MKNVKKYFRKNGYKKENSKEGMMGEIAVFAHNNPFLSHLIF